jgi:hypothetical protein
VNRRKWRLDHLDLADLDLAAVKIYIKRYKKYSNRQKHGFKITNWILANEIGLKKHAEGGGPHLCKLLGFFPHNQFGTDQNFPSLLVRDLPLFWRGLSQTPMLSIRQECFLHDSPWFYI